jgi:hypothetical protein
MSKSLQRKKPGYTKSGEVKVVSLSYKQCVEVLSKTSKKKHLGKIRNRMRILESRSGFVMPVSEPVEAVSE